MADNIVESSGLRLDGSTAWKQIRAPVCRCGPTPSLQHQPFLPSRRPVTIRNSLRAKEKRVDAGRDVDTLSRATYNDCTLGLWVHGSSMHPAAGGSPVPHSLNTDWGETDRVKLRTTWYDLQQIAGSAFKIGRPSNISRF